MAQIVVSGDAAQDAIQCGQLFRDNNIKSIAIDEGDNPFESFVNKNENCTKQSYDRYRRFRVYKSRRTVQASFLAHQPIALVYHERTKQFYVLVWESVNHCRQRTMNVVDFSGGTVIEGTYMVKKEAMVETFGAEEVDTTDSKPTFNYDIVSQSTACAAMPYMTMVQNGSNDITSEIHYFIRTEHHLELQKVTQGIPLFSYPSLYIS